MKKIFCLALALMLCVLPLCSCKKDNTLTCGVTIIPGLNEKDADGNWTGFESEFAMEVGKIIGMDVEFQEITWSQKYNELNSGAIDCIWNGFTANSSDDGIKRSDLVDFSYGYMVNHQCIVVRADKLAQFTDEASLAGKTAAVEEGSAGHDYAKTATDESKIITPETQLAALQEVKAGAVDFAVIDVVTARNVCGKGDYQDIAVAETINDFDLEYYAVGFKKDSELTAKVNAAIKELMENGKLLELAEKYDLEKELNFTETIG